MPHQASDSGALKEALNSIMYLAKRPGSLDQLQSCIDGLEDGDDSGDEDEYNDEPMEGPAKTEKAGPPKKSISILLGIPKLAPKKGASK